MRSFVLVVVLGVAVLGITLASGELVGPVARGAGAQPAQVAQVGVKVATVLQTTTTSGGHALQFPLFRNQWTVLLVEVEAGGQIGRHFHPVPNLVYVLEGELVIEADGQPPRTYRQGQAWSEGVDHWHNAFNRTATPAKFLGVFAGEVGKPVTVRP